MIASTLLTVMLAAGGSADALTNVSVKNVSLKAPAAWTRSNTEGSEKFLAPSGDAYFLVDVGTVQTAGMKAEVCRQKILASIGGTSWTMVKVGGQPAAFKSDTDAAPDGSGNVDTVTYVGCNGKTTWSVVFYMEQGKKDRFAAVAEKVGTSVTFTPPKGK
ncbi:MAG: hypothetical protein EOO71_31455 [Myxococcaceae bacterium]|uniref:Uncharacterized protein n=1 Tax=Corallococcus terminator TaxID=2316733 RepID=A0A3A8IDK5_9BACT|nr:hypothetical protein [Corallococcus terminator]RKG77870.1 hypothetical protein D7V88_30465 [Corallococcus terminator]RYZ36522.1 MAG: hypothetical protein EOO71_31455 [Myxococcaceae bacterium]